MKNTKPIENKGVWLFCSSQKVIAPAKVLKQQYASDLAEYNMEKNQTKEKPGKPQERMRFIPANNSTTGVFQPLSDN